MTLRSAIRATTTIGLSLGAQAAQIWAFIHIMGLLPHLDRMGGDAIVVLTWTLFGSTMKVAELTTPMAQTFDRIWPEPVPRLTVRPPPGAAETHDNLH